MSSPAAGRPALGDAGPAVPAETAEELYEQAPCGYLSTLPDGTIIKINQTLLSWLGYDRNEVVGRRGLPELLTTGGRIYHETHFAPLLLMQGSVREIAVDLVRADGRRLPSLLNAVLVRAPDGAPQVVRISVYDATDRRRYERELVRARERAEESEARARALAATLQASLLPPSIPAIPGLEVAAAYRPAGAGDEVGGDFYDVFETGRGDWTVALGDVRGKGPEAAAVTALARHTLRAAAIRTASPSAALQTLNAALLRDPAERFCTVVYLRVRFTRRRRVRVTISSGGHALPLRVRAGAVEPVGRPGSLLGVFTEPELHDHSVILRPGETIFCYTDGLTEGRRDAEFFGEARLFELLSRLGSGPASSLPTSAIDQVVEFQHGRPRDDMAAVAVGVPSA